MAVDERTRHELYNRLVKIMGEEHAEAMMQHLPPDGWSNLATKQDLLDLEVRMTSELKTHMFRTILGTNLTLAATFAAIAFGAAGLGN